MLCYHRCDAGVWCYHTCDTGMLCYYTGDTGVLCYHRCDAGAFCYLKCDGGVLSCNTCETVLLLYMNAVQQSLRGIYGYYWIGSADFAGLRLEHQRVTATYSAVREGHDMLHACSCPSRRLFHFVSFVITCYRNQLTLEHHHHHHHHHDHHHHHHDHHHSTPI